MSPRTAEQNLALQEESKRKIIEAALELFAERGYEGASVKKIAQGAGISQGLLYNYFDSKEHLLSEIMALGMGYIAKRFEVIPLDAPPMQQLETLLRELAVELETQAAFWRVFYSLRYLPAFDTLLGEEIIRHTNLLRAHFAELYEVAGASEPKLRAWALYAMLEGIIQQYLLFGEDYPLKAVVDEAVRVHCK
jgi:AcrR family transcriptional regulator